MRFSQYNVFYSGSNGCLYAYTYITKDKYKVFGRIIEEGEAVEYFEPIPEYMLSRYDKSAKDNLGSIKLVPVLGIEYIRVNFTISTTNET